MGRGHGFAGTGKNRGAPGLFRLDGGGGNLFGGKANGGKEGSGQGNREGSDEVGKRLGVIDEAIRAWEKARRQIRETNFGGKKQGVQAMLDPVLFKYEVRAIPTG